MKTYGLWADWENGRRGRSATRGPMIRRLLIANRGEIAVRIARTAREMGIAAVGVYSESDAGGFHLRPMERVVPLGGGPPSETYLSIPRLLEAAKKAGADAVHPGYGFLSENAAFARAVEEAGLTWVGPSPEAIEEMGDKLRARARMNAAGVPVVPGSDPLASSDEDLLAEARRIGWPVLVKAAAGGGGKGMLRVSREEELLPALAEARRIAAAAFGDDRLYLEKFFDRPRHVEFQIFGDAAGSVAPALRPGVQRPAPAPEDRRGDPEPRARRPAAAPDGGRGGRGRARGPLRRRGNGGVPARRPAQLLFPRDEHAAAGGAPDHGGDARDRSRAIPDRGGRRRPHPRRLGAPDAARTRHRGAPLRGRPVEFLPRSGEILDYEEPSGPGIRVDSGVDARIARRARIRPPARQARRRRAGSRRRHPADAPRGEGLGGPRRRDEPAAAPRRCWGPSPSSPAATRPTSSRLPAAGAPARSAAGRLDRGRPRAGLDAVSGEPAPAGPPDPWGEPSGWRSGA